MTGLYLIKNKINYKVYVGKAVDIQQRWRVHKHLLKNNKHFNRHLQNAWNHYGEDNFEFIVFQELPKHELSKAECELIKNLNSFGDGGYNLTAGGEGNLGRTLTEEQKRHLSEINMGEKNPNFNLKRSEETRRKMSLAMRGKRKPLSQQHKENISKGNKGKKKPWFNKTVKWVETGQIFPSISIAAKQTGFSITGISKVCKGERNSIYKQHFIFVK